MSVVVVRPCASYEDCAAVTGLCGAAFPQECHGQGLTVQQWASVEAEELRRQPAWWRQIGMAYEGAALLGVVVLTLENETDDGELSWSEYSARVGCGPTLLSMAYDRVLDEPLLEHECLIDFIAVVPEARGKGVGAKLMAWAEQAGAAILAETEAVAVAAHGVHMTLWVAADNAVAVRLYQRSGYTVVKRTDQGACHCMAARVFKWFLGHPVWIKMQKPLPAPDSLSTLKPEPLSIPVTAAAEQAQFVSVPLEGTPAFAPARQPRSPQAGCFGRNPRPAAAAANAVAAAGGHGLVSTAPHSPGRGLLRKLSSGGGGGSQGPTPRIAAHGGAFGSHASPREQSSQPEGGYTHLELRAIPSERGASREPSAKLAGLAAVGPAAAALAALNPSVASASLASLSVQSDSEDEAEGEGVGPQVLHPSQQFEVVELSAVSLA